MSRSDPEWIRRLKQNDPQALQDLWEMVYIDAINASRTRGQNENVADIAASAAYMRIWQRGIHQFNFKGRFPHYCRTIVVREVLRHLKKRPPSETNIDDVVHKIVAQDNLEANVISAEISTEIQEILTKCLEALSQRLRDIIDKLYFEGASPAKVAEELKLSRTNVNVLAYRARQNLKSCMEMNGHETTEDVFAL